MVAAVASAHQRKSRATYPTNAPRAGSRPPSTLGSATASVDFVMSAQRQQQDCFLTFVLRVFEDDTQIVTRAASPTAR
jgi:hypothetical protein